MRTVINIEGMACAHCEANCIRALSAVPGVTEAIVSHERGTAEVQYDEGATNAAALCKAVEDAGYTVVGQNGQPVIKAEEPKKPQKGGLFGLFKGK